MKTNRHAGAVIIFLCAIGSFSGHTGNADLQTGRNDLDNAVIAGYQGWFNCAGDGSPVDRWRHWRHGRQSPAPGFVTFELYPDVSEYDQHVLFPTNLGDLGDGRPAELFSSYPEEVIRQHLLWMRDNSIDGLALQRFIQETFGGGIRPLLKAGRDSVAVRVKRAAEIYGRVFFIMYDVSGFDGNEIGFLKNDWDSTMTGTLNITESPAYAHQNGRPVVGIWGLGFTHVSFSSEQALALVNWFKDKGYYVIGGVPTYWRFGINDSRPGFEEVYRTFDMISPWTVGRFSNTTGIDQYYNSILKYDQDYCFIHDIDYLPVIFPGFAWSNWNHGPQNEIPRAGGNFLWHQAFRIRQTGITSAYLAMFDEYDEATAIAPAADSYLSIPVNQYFLTYSADGIYRSSDFYLRLTAEAAKMIRQQLPLDREFSTKASAAPIFFRTSFEKGYDALPNWQNTQEESVPISNVSGPGQGNNPVCALSNSMANTGSYSIQIFGTDLQETGSYCLFKIIDVDIPVCENTFLSYFIFPEDENGRYVFVDLLATDGSRLSETDATDQFGNLVTPGVARGQADQWSGIVCQVGHWMKGKTINRILVGYANDSTKGPFTAYIDDVIIAVGSGTPVLHRPQAVKTGRKVRIFPNPVTGNYFTIELPGGHNETEHMINIFNANGVKVFKQPFKGNSAVINFRDMGTGLFFIKVFDGEKYISKKILRL